MNRLASVLFVLTLASAPAAVRAQENEGQTNLVLSLFGGISAGHSLWSIARQPLCVLMGSGGNYTGCQQVVTSPTDSGNLSDTLSFARDVSSSVMLGAMVSLFPNSHIGFQGEIYYLGLSFDDRCSNVGAPYQNDPENKNQQLCNSFGATGASASAVSFIGGVVLRASPHHAISPYLRAGVGLTTYTGGTLSVTGQFAVTDPSSGQLVLINRAVVVDTTPKTTSWTLQFGAGITARMSPGYQFRMELRDAVLPLERLIGPANDFGQAPHETKIYHHLGLTVGLDVVLEHRRGHRY